MWNTEREQGAKQLCHVCARFKGLGGGGAAIGCDGWAATQRVGGGGSGAMCEGRGGASEAPKSGAAVAKAHRFSQWLMQYFWGEKRPKRPRWRHFSPIQRGLKFCKLCTLGLCSAEALAMVRLFAASAATASLSISSLSLSRNALHRRHSPAGRFSPRLSPSPAAASTHFIHHNAPLFITLTPLPRSLSTGAPRRHLPRRARLLLERPPMLQEEAAPPPDDLRRADGPRPGTAL